MKDNSLISFDSIEIDQNIKTSKNGRYKINNSIFTFIKDNIKKQENQKYFVKIKNNNEEYVGALTDNFKKELFGYSLFNQGDEYLGEIHEEKKEGFGIYIFKLKENDKQDIYIGYFKNNMMNGEGIYINIINNITNLEEYICYIGAFENGLFKKGKIYVFKKDFEKLYFQNEENEDNKFCIERKNEIILANKGVIKNDKLNEGIMIIASIKDINKIENIFYFKEKENSQYIFENLDDEKKEKEIVEEFNKYKLNFMEYNKIIKNLVKKIKNETEQFKRNLDYSQYVIETNLKKNLLDEKIEKIVFS